MQPKIVVMLPQSTPELFLFSHWLLNWPFALHFNFWVRAQRKTAQNGPKSALFQISSKSGKRIKVYSTILRGCWREKVVSFFGFGHLKSHFSAPGYGHRRSCSWPCRGSCPQCCTAGCAHLDINNVSCACLLNSLAVSCDILLTVGWSPRNFQNGPKKVPILPQRPEFCLCKDFSS